MTASMTPVSRSCAIALVTMVGAARADDLPVEIHGFVSQGAIKSTDNDFLVDSDRGSLEYFEAGLNVTKQISDRLRTGIQLFAHDLGTTGEYRPKLDWAYLDYHLSDALGVRAGHIKIPFGLYADTADIDAARPTALLPQAFYPELNRNYLLAQSGAEVYGYHRFDDVGALDYQLYGGMISIDLPDQPPGPIYVRRLSIPYVVGGRVMYEAPVEGLRIGASVEHLQLEEDADVAFDPTTMAPGSIALRAPTTLAAGSIEYQHDNLLLAAEYARWSSKLTSDNMPLVPNASVVDRRAYGLAAYRFSPHVQLASYYAIYLPADDHVPAGRQHDVDLTLRLDVTPNWLLKLETHAMRGTSLLDASLQDGPIADHWWLFLAKTTVVF